MWDSLCFTLSLTWRVLSMWRVSFCFLSTYIHDRWVYSLWAQHHPWVFSLWFTLHTLPLAMPNPRLKYHWFCTSMALIPLVGEISGLVGSHSVVHHMLWHHLETKKLVQLFQRSLYIKATLSFHISSIWILVLYIHKGITNFNKSIIVFMVRDLSKTPQNKNDQSSMAHSAELHPNHYYLQIVIWNSSHQSL